jgi:opacity protein-like surface antigen
MKRRIAIIFLFLPFVLLSQTNDTIKTKVSPQKTDTLRKGKFEIGISFSPDYTYRKLKSDAQSKDIADIRDTMETAKFGYTAGLNLAYHINKRFVIETGLLFSDKGEKTKKVSFTNVPSGQLPIYYTYKYHYLYLDVPLKVDYYILTGKFKFYATAGVSGNIFLTQKTTLIQGHDNGDSESTVSTNSSGFNRINFAVLAGIGLDYPISNKLKLQIEPVYRLSVTSIVDAPIKSYLYSAGVNFGLYFNL